MITYPIIASEILNRLFEGPKRSSDLTKGLGFSSKLIYQTLDEMEKDAILLIQTDRPKFKVYQITDKGAEIAVDSKVKSQGGALQQMKKSPELNKMFVEMYTKFLSEQIQRRVQPQLGESFNYAMETMIPHIGIFLSSTAAHSRSAKKIFDNIDNQPSKTLAPTLEISTSAT